jgi:hypothetical protein
MGVPPVSGTGRGGGESGLAELGRAGWLAGPRKRRCGELGREEERAAGLALGW